MKRLPLLLTGLFVVAVGAPAQSPAPPEPTIDLKVSGQSGTPGSGQGTATVSGKVNLPPGWKITVHTLTIRYQKNGTATTVNAFVSVKGAPFNFQTKLELPVGSYSVWGVIDVKDADGREKQIASPAQGVPIQ
jgi:uncharacterized lipoprotein YbaY